MDTLRAIVLQEANEEKYSRKHIDVKIRHAIESNPIMVEKLNQGVELVNEYLKGQYYPSKMKRIAQLENLDIYALVMDIFVGIAYSQKPELFTSVSAQMSARLKFSDRTEAITTVAELMAVLCATDAFDIEKENKLASLMVVSRIPLGEVLIDFIMNSQYLPPMLCEPLELTHNYSSGYLTHNDSLILGQGNHHDGDICLDVLNIMNKVCLKLDTQFLSTVEEEPNHDLVTQDQIDQWKHFKEQSYMFYMLLVEQGNTLYFNHKVDKRGRIYSQGYHINTQGTSFKKAMLELNHEEYVDGVP
jgi:hypothetical protein